MVALVFGQSNAGNWGDVRAVAGPRVFNLRYRSLTRAADPLRGAEGEGGSVWTRLGDQIINAGWYDEVVFVPVSFGASEIAKWTPDQPLFKQIDDAIDDVRARGWQFTHLLWHQGESDNALRIGYADYQLRLRNIVRGLRERGVGAPMFVSQATLCGQYAPNNDIRGAQASVVNHGAAIWAGPDTDVLGADFRHDGCHLSARGQLAASGLWLDKLAAYERR